MSDHQIPLLKTVDVVILGAGTAAVAAALSVKAAGRSVYVVSDRAYFGDESAGTLESVVSNPDKGRPGVVKHVLERELLDAGVDFLFMTRAVALHREADGQIALLLAAHTSLFTLWATQLIDATLEGSLHALPGVERWISSAPRPASRRHASLYLFTDSAGPAPAFPGATLEPLGMPFPYRDRPEPLRIDLQLHRASLPVAKGGDIAGVEAHVRNVFSRTGVEMLPDVVRWEWAGNGSCHDPLALPENAFFLHSQISHCGSALPLSGAGLNLLYDPAIARALGDRVGRLVASRSLVAESPAVVAVPCPSKYRFAPAFLRNGGHFSDFAFPEWPEVEGYDVVVAGGGTAGAPAALAAARSGRRVLLLEHQRKLGGVGTAGTIASYWFGNKVGFTSEIDSALLAADPRYNDPERKRSDKQWNVELKAGWYLKEIIAAGGDVWLGSFVFGVRMSEDQITGLLVSTPHGPRLVPTICAIDATGNADLAAAAGAPCRTTDSAHCAVQGSGLSPVQPGKHYVNTDFTFIDDSDPAGVTYAYIQARAKFQSDFDVLTFLNTRERRQIIGEIELSPLDFLAGRTFPDVINIARSNFDTHGFTIHPVFAVTPPDHAPLTANVPLRCLKPRGVSGLLVTGLGMSAHRDSLPVIRMQADVQNQGYAAGLAADMACDSRGDYSRIDLKELQQRIIAMGGLPEEVLQWSDSFPLPSAVIAHAAAETPSSIFSAAILLAHPEESVQLLQRIVKESEAPEQREEASLILGLIGDPSIAPKLIELIGRREWDEGWNYRGMGQFGLSASRLDALIMALARTGTCAGVHEITAKINALDSSASFSHCRAVAIASATIAAPELASALHDLLQEPGIRGHAITAATEGISAANDDSVETAPRNFSLRELYLAKGLYLAGDIDGVGKSILETYRHDLRGLYARHAAAVLDHNSLDQLRREMT